MRLVFMGTPDFASAALEALLAAGHEIAAVYTQPPRPAGRGQDVRTSAVQALAERHGLPVRTPLSLKDKDVQAAFAALGADVAVVAAYGLMLPQAFLDAPKFGCLNIHASLLPRWRGAAPIQRAILAGDRETGISIMQMEAGLDTGPVLAREVLKIGHEANAGHLHDALADIGARLIVATLPRLPLEPCPQAEEGVTYAAKISPAEARLDWPQSATLLERAVRAFAPHPGAWCNLPDGGRLKVLKAEIVPGSGIPGTVLDDRLAIACGAGALRLDVVQKAGRKPMPAGEFLRGRALAKGDRLA